MEKNKLVKIFILVTFIAGLVVFIVLAVKRGRDQFWMWLEGDVMRRSNNLIKKKNSKRRKLTLRRFHHKTALKKIELTTENKKTPKRSKYTIFDYCVASVFFVSLITLSFYVTQIVNWNSENMNTDNILNNIKSIVMGEDIDLGDGLIDPEMVGLTPMIMPTIESEALEYEGVTARKLYFDIDFAELITQNSDTVGWLRVPGALIDMPVVKGQDNQFYLYRDFYKKDTGAGWIFADSEAIVGIDARNIIIYGHNRQNGSAFGSIKDLLKTDVLSVIENKQAWLNTPTEFFHYEIISIYYASAFDDCYQMYFDSDSEYEDYLKKCVGRSLVNFEVEVSSKDKIVTLSTCKSNAENERLVVQFRLIDWYMKQGGY